MKTLADKVNSEEKIPFADILDEAEQIIQKARAHEEEHPEKVREIFCTLSDALIDALEPAGSIAAVEA